MVKNIVSLVCKKSNKKFAGKTLVKTLELHFSGWEESNRKGS